MENKESGSLLLLAGSIPLFTKEEYNKGNHDGGVNHDGGDNIKSELTAGFGSEAADAAKLLLLYHNNGVAAEGQQERICNDKTNTIGNRQHRPIVKDKEVNVVMEEFGKINRETNSGGDVESITLPKAHVSPKLNQTQGGVENGEISFPQPMLDSLVDLATKELMSIESENECVSPSTFNDDMVDNSSIANGCGPVLKNDVGENGLVNEHYNSNGLNHVGMVTRNGGNIQRPRSVSDPEGVNEWGCDRVVKMFDTIKEESYEGGDEKTSNSIMNFVPPHDLAKYASTYNQYGRVGIYTSKERAAIIARFKSKRERRTWRKKIRYNCRKSLAEKRARIKGRFVKLSGSDPAQEATKSRSRSRSISFTSQTSEDAPASPIENEKWEEYDEAEIYHRVRRHSVA